MTWSVLLGSWYETTKPSDVLLVGVCGDLYIENVSDVSI
jgi:hypothetical protein